MEDDCKQRPPLRESDIIFPSAAIPGGNNINATLGELKKANLSLRNRFWSIRQDAEFVARVGECITVTSQDNNAVRTSLPRIANERCGSWYIHPSQKAGSAYFKSTDGHHGQWSFSLRRLNLHILELIGNHGGCVIVDSTRRGKSMPDALSKSIPIWIAVLNELLFPRAVGDKLYTPSNVVGDSEHAQILARLNGFVEAVRTLDLDLPHLRQELKDKALRAVWITPMSDLESIELDESYNNIVLCTASNLSSSKDATGDYVQGAADDAESWALGLDAVAFWNSVDLLCETSEDSLPAVIARILMTKSRSSTVNTRQTVIAVHPTKCIFVSDNASAELLGNSFDAVITCNDKTSTSIKEQTCIRLHCKPGKIGSRQLRSELVKIMSDNSPLRNFAGDLVAPRILVADSEFESRDLSIGVALAVICMLCNDDGSFNLSRLKSSGGNQMNLPNINKTVIKKRLSWIMMSLPEAKPSRATLQSVNAFLLS